MNQRKFSFLHWIALPALCFVSLGSPLARAQDPGSRQPADVAAAAVPDHVTPDHVTPDTEAPNRDLPEDPGAVLQQQSANPPAQSNPNSSYEGKQTKRILGIVPNFRSVSVDAKLKPMTVKEKFIGAAEDSFDYSSFIFVGAIAGVAQAENSYPQFHQGAAGFARYYWHSFADQTDENFMVEFILPSALHQDPRYYTLGRGGFLKRTAYSFSRIAITRQDDGHNTFNFSEVVGSGAASGISSLYYPTADRDWTKVGQRWATSLALDGATFIVKEFWPDINSKIFHQKN
jgi:hypothetical protein